MFITEKLKRYSMSYSIAFFLDIINSYLVQCSFIEIDNLVSLADVKNNIGVFLAVSFLLNSVLNELYHML